MKGQIIFSIATVKVADSMFMKQRNIADCVHARNPRILMETIATHLKHKDEIQLLKEDLIKQIKCPYGEAGTDICIGERCQQFDKSLHKCKMVRNKVEKTRTGDRTR